jgi:hypothetical protein
MQSTCTFNKELCCIFTAYCSPTVEQNKSRHAFFEHLLLSRSPSFAMPSRLSLLNIYFLKSLQKKKIRSWIGCENKCLENLSILAAITSKFSFLKVHSLILPDSESSKQRPNSWTYMGQKSLEFSSLLLKLVCNANIAEKSSLRTLKIMQRNLNEIVYVHEFGFSTLTILYTL